MAQQIQQYGTADTASWLADTALTPEMEGGPACVDT